jgi:hypothetical protein
METEQYCKKSDINYYRSRDLNYKLWDRGGHIENQSQLFYA